MPSIDRIRAFIRQIVFRQKVAAVPFTDLFARFQQILEDNNQAMEVIADMGDKLSGQYVFDSKYLEDRVASIEKIVLRSAYNFNFITANRHFQVYHLIETLARQLKLELAGQLVIPSGRTVSTPEGCPGSHGRGGGQQGVSSFQTDESAAGPCA